MALRHPHDPHVSRAAICISAVNTIVYLLWFLAAVFASPVAPVIAKEPEEGPTYALLLDYIQMENRRAPLVEFARTGQAVDHDLSRENRRYISQNDALLDKIKTELDSNDLQWQLRTATQRLMVVPEKHPEYAALFEAYCRTVVDYVLEKTQLPNPYGAIATLDGPPAEAFDAGQNRVTAYLVHNIADVYTEEYIFFDHCKQERKISIKLDNRSYLGEIGSYSSYLIIEGEQRYTFERNPYTLWRNSAENPLNVFVAPVEETLHIALRKATEAAIRSRLGETPPQTLEDIEAVVEEWLAVEEAVVGGLVNALMPEILDTFVAPDASAELAQSLAERQAFEKYRYLAKGVALVDRLGLQSAIRIYLSQPRQFKTLLTMPAAETTAEPVEASQPHRQG
jgi:hypothetical protein